MCATPTDLQENSKATSWTCQDGAMHKTVCVLDSCDTVLSFAMGLRNTLLSECLRWHEQRRRQQRLPSDTLQKLRQTGLASEGFGVC
eukprot:4643846-Amphidinium_carterae.1